jgi:hypothetical protein
MSDEMKKRIPRSQLSGEIAVSRTTTTGEHCPLTGWWGSDTDARFIAEGAIMPAHRGRPVAWVLLANERGTRKPTDTLPAVGAFIDSC